MGLILIFGSGDIGNIGTFHFFAFVDIPYLIVTLSSSIAVRTSDHLYILRTAGTVITTVSCTNRTTHTIGALRSDQQNSPTAPAATHPTILKKSPSIIDKKNADMLTKPHNPANSVSKRLPVNPMTFMKVIDTIDFISDDLSVVKLDDVYSLVSVIAGIPVKAEP